MLQRSVKLAEDECRKWRQRYAMVEKDLKRSEKLLKDFTKSKMKELELKHGVAASRLSEENLAAIQESPRRETFSESSFGGSSGKQPKATMGLSQMARGFKSIDTLLVDTGDNSSALMEAVFGIGQKATTAQSGAQSPRSFKIANNKFGGKTTEIAEGMPIDFHDTYHDIAVKNNRRGTAKARSLARQPGLWSENLED